LKQGVIKLYNIKETDKKLLQKKIEIISLRWKPYRTYASRYLWGWKDGLPARVRKTSSK
jgi:DNA-3-methyladenine glycosylase II